MATNTYTVAQVSADSELLEALKSSYSDAFKGINGFRPRCESLWTVEAIVRFWNDYDRMFEASQEEERRELAALSERYGIEFASWSAYYDYLDRLSWQEYEAERKAREDKENFVREFFRRWSPLAAITLWEEGAIG